MIETQIVLAIVGALIMLVVGASLARAFGIAGAANLIRYRAKIEDPKDAVVMLSALAVGLAAGVGLFGIGAVGTGFLVITLWIIEGFETHVRTFLLSVKLGPTTSDRRPASMQRAGGRSRPGSVHKVSRIPACRATVARSCRRAERSTGGARE